MCGDGAAAALQLLEILAATVVIAYLPTMPASLPPQHHIN